MSPDIAGRRVDFTKPLTSIHRAWPHARLGPSTSDTREETVTPSASTPGLVWHASYGSAEEGKDNGFEYPRKDTDTWTRMEKSQITFDGGAFHRPPHGASLRSPLMWPGPTAAATMARRLSLPHRARPNCPTVTSRTGGSTKVWIHAPEGGLQYWDTGNKVPLLSARATLILRRHSIGARRSHVSSQVCGVGIIGNLRRQIFAAYVRPRHPRFLSFGHPWKTATHASDRMV